MGQADRAVPVSQEAAEPGNLVLRAAYVFNGLGVCRVCGCTEDDPCIEDVFGAVPGRCCSWAAPDLCSACVEPAPLLYDAYGGVLVR